MYVVKRNVLTAALVLLMTGYAGCPTNPPFKGVFRDRAIESH